MMLKFQKEDAGKFFVLGLFTIGVLLYLNINKLPLTHPGNIKAADPFYHTVLTEEIIDTKQWDYFGSAFSLGHEKLVNTQPPLLYLNSAILSIFSGLPPWVTIYFLVCIHQAFLIILIYLLSKEIFDKESIALLAAAFMVIPMSVHAWLYSVYIGFWIQVAAYFFMMAFFWLFIRYLKTGESWPLFFIGLCISSVLMIHPMDLSMMLLPSVIVGIKMMKSLAKERDTKKFIKDAALLAIFPTIMLIALLPRLLFVWSAMGSNQFKFGFYGLHSNMYSRDYGGGLVFPDIFFLPWPALVLFALGLVQLFLNFRKYRLWLLSTSYYFFIIYLLPIFIEGPYYFGRARALTPFFVMPVIGYTIYYFGIRFLKDEKKQLIAAAVICLLAIWIAFPQYLKVSENMVGEHISLHKWQAYKWLHENTEKTDKILFYGGIFQSENIYAKRITALIPLDEIQNIGNELIATGDTPLSFTVHWGGNTVRAGGFYEKSWLSYGKITEPSNNASIFDFDYIIFQDFVPGISDLNRRLIETYSRFGFRKVYDNQGIKILKNEKKL